MNIFYDHQTFSLQTFGGISRYFTELIKGINQSSGNRAYLPLLFSNNSHLGESGLTVRRLSPDRDFYKKIQIIYRLNQAYTIAQMRRNYFDIFHATYYDPYFIPHLKGRPFVITFHDMIHEKFSNHYKEFGEDKQHARFKKILAEQATRIIAVSEHTKRDIVDILDINPDKIQVIYHGNSLVDEDSNLIQSNNPYFLYVGNRQRYKNFRGLLQAISPILKQYKLSLTCAGGGGFDLDEKNFIYSLGLTSYVEQKYIDDDEALRYLYKSAIAFIFPSKYEGFGIPILEAFACGCPCILSNSSSLPEVGGDAALYFDPNDNNSIRCAIELIISSKRLRNELVAKGHHRLVRFSWSRAIHETIFTYRSCL